MTLCQILSEFVSERRDFSEEAIYLAKKSILDSMGAIAREAEHTLWKEH